MRPSGIAVGGLLLSLGCAARTPPPSVVSVGPPTGVTSVRVLGDEAAPPPPAEPDAEKITPAFASEENKLPEYPAYALRHGCQLGVVPVRIYVGADGNVSTVKPVPGRPVANDWCHSAFSGSTYAAVQRWRFAPAFRQTPHPGADIDGDGRPDLTKWEQTPITVYLDFEFTFRVVGGKGEVQSR